MPITHGSNIRTQTEAAQQFITDSTCGSNTSHHQRCVAILEGLNYYSNTVNQLFFVYNGMASLLNALMQRPEVAPICHVILKNLNSPERDRRSLWALVLRTVHCYAAACTLHHP
jgi:hypothetical protein